MWWRPRNDQDFRQEIETHLALETDRLVREGFDLKDARDAAHQAFGSVTATQERFYEARRVMWLDDLQRDLRYAGRVLYRSPAFAAVAVLSIALGIGANTAIFTLVNALLLRPPTAIADPNRLVDIGVTRRGEGFNTVSYPNYLDLRERATTLDGVYAYLVIDTAMSLGSSDGAERIFGKIVTTNYFTVLGVRAAAGRLFGMGDREHPGASPIVVLSHSFWARHYHADPAVVGQPLTLNGHPFTVIGIAPEGFHGTTVLASDVWVPMAMVAEAMPRQSVTILHERGDAWLNMGGRLKPGISLAVAQAELASLAQGLVREHPEDNRAMGLRAAPISVVPGFTGYVTAFMVLLMAIVALVLLVVCANLAGVLMARGVERRHELAVRLALGAGRPRVIAQLLTETMLVFLAGGVAGVTLGRMATTLLIRLLPRLPLAVDVDLTLDHRVMLFTLLVSCAAALVSGVVPAMQTTQVDVIPALKDDTQGGFRRSQLQSAFLVGQIALSLVLVIAAAILVQALQRAGSVDVGFDSVGVELTAVDLSLAGYTDTTGRVFLREMTERVRQIPGVQSASVAAALPLGTVSLGLGAWSVPGDAPERAVFLGGNFVEPRYFATMRTALVRGRDFTEQDDNGAPEVVILNETAARRFWPGEDPLGKRITNNTRGPGGREARTMTVVGVARDGKYRSVGEASQPFVYLPLRQRSLPGLPSLTLVTRAARGQRVAAEVRRLLAIASPNLPVLTSQTLDDYTAFGLVPLRVAVAVSTSLGVVSLLLAMIGIYGMAAYTVSRRTREIGIRIAVGAQPRDVLTLVCRRGIVLTGIGVLIGVVLSLPMSRLLTNLPLGLSPFAPLTFIVVMVLFAVVAMLASYIPARRATHVDPLIALRAE
jgi:predicted permease